MLTMGNCAGAVCTQAVCAHGCVPMPTMGGVRSQQLPREAAHHQRA